jgi:D-alanine-D-alanine ligase
MKEEFKIVVLCGGTSEERSVSLRSGAAVAKALGAAYEVEFLQLEADSLPESIEGQHSIVFPVLHGGFGEDGGLQALFEAAEIEYCGSDAASSRVCMNKDTTKALAVKLGVAVPECYFFDGNSVPLADVVIAQLGTSLVLKPTDQGSSVGLYFTEHRSELGVALSHIDVGNWMVERRIRGRELTVGVLDGQAMGVVEVVSASGVYDYAAKYTPGASEYLYPAELDPAITDQIQRQAESIFNACGCRDFARIDFLLEGSTPYFLEINTLPGMTETSLLPKSASCADYDFVGLVSAMVAPAIARFNAKKGAGT